MLLLYIFHGAFQKLLEQYNEWIAAGGDYFEGDESFMCVLSIKMPIRKKSGNLFKDPCIYIYIYIYIYKQDLALNNLKGWYAIKQQPPNLIHIEDVNTNK